MPYVPEFANDIFISFAHVDNSRGWVKNFQDQLNDRLAQLGAAVTIWRDSELRGTDVFSDEIFALLQQSALLISIVSPLGIRSGWCEDERQAFERFAALNGGFRFGNKLRAIKVVKTPLPGDQHRDLFGALGFEFYQRETQSERFYEFDQSGPEFYKKLDELAQDLKSLLDMFSQHLKTRSQKDTVYVATTTPDLKLSRDKIVRQLNDWGYAVVPQDSDQPRRVASFQAVTKAALTASIFSVHLASDQPQPISEDQHDSITGQYELAELLRKDRIVWVEAERRLYSNFNDALKRGLQNGLEILTDRGIEDLKEVIRDKLDQRSNHSSRGKNEAGVQLSLIRTNQISKASGSGERVLSASRNGNPFPGLRSFKREQAHLFFGRDEQIIDLIERLKEHRFLPIVGVSGSGKSSLVHAGLIPALAGNHVSAEQSRWRIAVVRPGIDPMHELATQMCREFALSEFDSALQTLCGSSAGLARVVRQHLGPKEKLLILVDQFEELFRYHEETDPADEMNDNVASLSSCWRLLVKAGIHYRDSTIYPYTL